MRHSIPDGDVAAIFDVLDALLADLRRTKHASRSPAHDVPHGGSSGRHIPAASSVRSGNATAVSARSSAQRSLH